MVTRSNYTNSECFTSDSSSPLICSYPLGPAPVHHWYLLESIPAGWQVLAQPWTLTKTQRAVMGWAVAYLENM